MSDTHPQTLGDVVHGDQGDFRLAIGYSLALTHSLMPHYPAIFEGTDRVVLVFDRGLLEQVWQLLTPRKSHVDEGLCYYSERLGLAFPVFAARDIKETLARRSMPVLSRQEFAEVTANGNVPFRWAPGLVGPDMSLEEFGETLRASVARLSAA